mmetsp:Transcript_10055/g.34680  ORF Transcript_10055/g.34680 Transcript_10055/m.34680 type:complete len:286 (-) Transcript_10055:170-1027(-)
MSMKMPTSCVQLCMRAVSPSRNRLKPRGEASFRRYANTGNLVDFFRYLQSLAYSSKAHVMAIVSSDTFSLSLRDVIYRYQSSAINGLWFEMLMMAANGADHGRVADAADLDWIMFVCVLILQSLSINKFTSPTVISLCKAAKVPLSGEGAKSREGLQCWKHTIELVICLVDIHSRCITDCACSYSAAEHYITAGKILETYVDITLEPRLPSRNVMIGAARLRQIIIGALGSPAISVGAVRALVEIIFITAKLDQDSMRSSFESSTSKRIFFTPDILPKQACALLE